MKFLGICNNIFTYACWSQIDTKDFSSIISKYARLFEGRCSFGKTYIDETRQNVHIRWEEHTHPNGSFEPAKHFVAKPFHFNMANLLNKILQ